MRNYYRVNTPPPAGTGKKSAHMMNYLLRSKSTLLRTRAKGDSDEEL